MGRRAVIGLALVALLASGWGPGHFVAVAKKVSTVFFFGPQGFESGTTLASAGMASLGGTPTIETAAPRTGSNHFRIDSAGLEWANQSGDLTITSTQLCIDAYLKRTADRAATNIFLGLGRAAINYAPYVCSGASSGTLKMACGVGCTTAASSDLSGFSGAAYQRMQIEWDSSLGTGKLGLDHGTPVTCDGADSQTMFPRWAWGKNTSGFQYELDDYAIYKGVCWHPPPVKASNTFKIASSSATFTCTHGLTIAEGDLVLIWVAEGRGADSICADGDGVDDDDCDASQGLTEIQDQTSNDMGVALYYKIAGASEPSGYSFENATASGARHWTCGVVTVPKSNFATPAVIGSSCTVDTSISTPNGDLSCPSLTGQTDKSLVLRLMGVDDQTSFAAEPGTVLWADFQSNSGSHSVTQSGSWSRLSGTSTGTASFDDIANNSHGVCCTVTVKPSTDPNP